MENEITSQKQTNISNSRPPKSLTRKQVATIFLTLKATYGRKFMAAFNSQAEIEAGQAVWAKYCGFLTDYEIETALNNCIQMSDWSPNVSEFLRVALGYPDINQAVSRVINDDCSDVVSYEIRKQIGSWDIGHQTQTVIASRIRGLYDDAYLNAIEVKRGQ